MSLDTPKAALTAALAHLDCESQALEPGHVWLAGAGPGDPRLPTLHALGALAQTYALVHDALVSPQIIAIAAQAGKFHVGKRGGQLSIPQKEINALLVKLDRERCKVVRLKTGHPYVFGRGGEEARALVEAVAREKNRLAGARRRRPYHGAAWATGASKTSVTIGLLRALARRGLRVRGAKSGRSGAASDLAALYGITRKMLGLLGHVSSSLFHAIARAET